MIQDVKVVLNFLSDVLVLLANTIYFTIQNIAYSVLPRPKKSVKGEIVLITGAGHGLGKELAIKFAGLGAIVVLWSTTKPRVDEIAGYIRRKGGVAYCYQCDVSDELKVELLAARVRKEVGDVTILINNAGILSGKSITQLSNTEIRRTIDVNLLGHFWTIKQFLPKMKELGRGHVVAVGSIASLLGSSNASDYCASKFGMRGLMCALREELHKEDLEDRIQLTLVCPGIFESGFVKKPKTKYSFILPVMTTSDVCQKTVDAILRNEDMLVIPGGAKYCLWMKEVFLSRTMGRKAQRTAEYGFDT